MRPNPSQEVHRWVADQLNRGVKRDHVLMALIKADQDPQLHALHEWVVEQARIPNSKEVVRAAIVKDGWSRQAAEWVLDCHYKSIPSRKLTSVEMRSFVSKSKVVVEVDLDDHAACSGGFGLVCKVEGDESYLAKRLEVRPPVPLGQARKYLTHVRIARDRLGAAWDSATSPVKGFLTQILENSLSTHFSYEENEDGMVAAIWFLIPRASGKDLNEHFRTDRRNPPDVEERISIATAFVQRMRTLRRPGLVHMDCTVDNIRLDREKRQLVMIDLDGCGIERQSPENLHRKFKSDKWDVEPMTLGKQGRMVRVPPWYPQEGIKCGPNTGNYKFGERWVALDTILRILSWGRIDALGWLEPRVRADLGNRYASVTQELALFVGEPESADLLLRWQTSYLSQLNECAKIHRPLTWFTTDDALRLGCPPCFAAFANLAQDAYFEPRELSGQPDGAGMPRSIYKDFAEMLDWRAS